MKSIIAFTIAFALLAPSTARAATCTNDVDCNDNPNYCGGMVCQWGAAHTCVAAGTDPQGSDGWCSLDSHCKCMAQGATCNTAVHHCTFTLLVDMAGAPVHDLATTAPADLATTTVHDLSMPSSGSPDLSMPSGGNPPQSKSGCAIGGAESPSLPSLVLLVAGALAWRRRGRIFHAQT